MTAAATTGHVDDARRRLLTGVELSDRYRIFSAVCGLLDFGEARRLREQAGLSRHDMAQRAHIDETHLARWERHGATPSVGVVQLYGRVLATLIEGMS